MADLGNTHIHITWDTEPTEDAKAFIRDEVIAALKELIGEGSWFKELVQDEVKRAVSDSELLGLPKAVRILNGYRGA